MASASSTTYSDAPIKVVSPLVTYTDDVVEAKYSYETTSVTVDEKGGLVAQPVTTGFTFRTQRKVPKVGVMIAGLGGNNGTTLTASILANKTGTCWMTKEGKKTPNYFGSVTQASTVRLGSDAAGKDVYVPMSRVLPMVHPNEWVVTGWDISGANLADAMARAAVLPYDLQRQLAPAMKAMVPLPGIYDPDFIAANQEDRADNVIPGTKAEQVAAVRKHISDFKASSGVDKVVVVWSANTERFSDVREGLNTTAAELLASIEKGEAEVSPSTLMAVAAIQEGCTYINGSPQNTFVPGVIEMAAEAGVYIGGDDFKSGQTKMKSVLVDFLVGAGIKPASIVSYNHLGNNDGKNLSAPKQFRSKEISKSNVVDDMVASNGILYAPGEVPDHCVVIKYVPYVGDSKRAMDEYTSEIFMGGSNTIVMHNTCEDSLLAAPLIIDLVVLGELTERMTIKQDGEESFHGFHAVLSLLSYLLKAPLVPTGAPVINALFKQREAITNVLRAAVGLPPENHMLLEHRMPGVGALSAMAGGAGPVAAAGGAAAEEVKE